MLFKMILLLLFACGVVIAVLFAVLCCISMYVHRFPLSYLSEPNYNPVTPFNNITNGSNGGLLSHNQLSQQNHHQQQQLHQQQQQQQQQQQWNYLPQPHEQQTTASYMSGIQGSGGLGGMDMQSTPPAYPTPPPPMPHDTLCPPVHPQSGNFMIQASDAPKSNPSATSGN